MPSASDSPRPRSWFRLQFSMGTMFWIMLVVGMAMAWWKDRMTFERRLQKLEQMYSMEPQSMWEVEEVLGANNDPTGLAGRSWCPSRTNVADWVEVGFDSSVRAAAIDLYATYAVGCVTKIIVTDGYGVQTTIWQGTDPTPKAARVGLFRVPVPNTIRSVKKVKIHLDSTGTNSWACLDAVGLTTASGKTVWASSADCSSVYGNGALSAVGKKSSWFSFW